MSFRTFSSPSLLNRDAHVTTPSRPTSSRLSHALAFALCLAGLSLGACGSDTSAGSDPTALDERSCQGDVGATCPATFDDVLTAAWTCVDRENIWAGECMTNGPLTLNRNWGTHQSNCFYDATSRQLVGANVVNDTPTYCNNTSHSLSKGNVPVDYPHYCVGGSAGSQRSMKCGTSP